MAQTEQSHLDRTISHQDDISVRDIYLIIRKNLRLIIVLPVVFAVIAFLIVSFLPANYEAESVALVNPTPIRASGSTLSYRPSNEVSFETYQTLAESKAVIEQAIASADIELTASQFTGKVSKLLGPQRPDQVVSLLVNHTVTHSDPEAATRLANEWAEASLKTVQDSLISNLDPLIQEARQASDELEQELITAEIALQDFQADNNLKSLKLKLEQLAVLIANAETQMVPVAELSGQSIVLNLSLGSNQEDDQLSAESAVSLIQEIAANEAFVAELASQSLSEGLEDELLSRRALIRSLKARQTVLVEQLSVYQAEYRSAKAELSRLEQEENLLLREVDLAEAAFDNVVVLSPTFDFLSKVTQSNTQLFRPAAVPVTSSGFSALLSALVALIASVFIVLLFVFIREAVSE